MGGGARDGPPPHGALPDAVGRYTRRGFFVIDGVPAIRVKSDVTLRQDARKKFIPPSRNRTFYRAEQSPTEAFPPVIRVNHELADEYALPLANGTDGADEATFAVHGLDNEPARVLTRQFFQSLLQRRNLTPRSVRTRS